MKHLSPFLLTILILSSVFPAQAQDSSQHEPITRQNASQLVLLETISVCSRAISIAISPDSSRLAFGCTETENVHLWDLGFEVELITLPAYHALAVAFSPDGKILATGDWNGDEAQAPIQLWDAQTGALLKTLKGHTLEERDLAFSPDGTLLASASNDSTVRLWNVGFGREMAVLEGNTRGSDAVRVVFSPDGEQLLSLGDVARVWDTHTGSLLQEQTGSWWIEGILTTGGLMLATGYTVTAQETIFYSSPTLDSNPNAYTSKGAFNSDGSLLALPFCLVEGCANGSIVLFDATETAQEIASLGGITSPVMEITFSPDGTLLATAALDGTVKVWGIPPGRG